MDHRGGTRGQVRTSVGFSSPSSSKQVVGSWELVSVLGSGSFAIVWKAYHVSERDEVNGGERKVAAVKEIQKSKLTPKLRQSLEGEIHTLRHIHHPNVVKLFEVVESQGKMYLVMEYCGGGDLSHRLKERGRLDGVVVQHIMKQLASGMEAMQRYHVVHRDLKPQNLLLVDDSDMPLVKIADFGFARALGPALMAETLCGSPLYMAPEILMGQQYDAKADLWSIGAIMFEMLCGKPPYSGANQASLLKEMKNRDPCVPSDISMELSYSCKSLMHKLLRRRSVERISFEGFFSHPYIALDGGQWRHMLPYDNRMSVPPSTERKDSVSQHDVDVEFEEKDDFIVLHHSPRSLTKELDTIAMPVFPRQAQHVGESMMQSVRNDTELRNDSSGDLDLSVARIPWQNYGKFEFLIEVARLLHTLGEDVSCTSRTPAEIVLNKLAFYVSSMQIFNVVLDALNASKEGLDSTDSMEHVDTSALTHDACQAARRAQETICKLHKYHPYYNDAGGCVPEWIEVCHRAAQRMCEEGAAEELLGNFAKCKYHYEKAGLLLYFLAVESVELMSASSEGAQLDFELLQKQQIAVAVRWVVVTKNSNKTLLQS